MDPSSWQQVKEVFSEAAELPVAEQSNFVQQSTNGEPEVKAEVLRLLRLHADPSSRMERAQPLAAGLVAAAAQQHAFFPGESLAGRYRISRFIAQGGMGEVYEAEDLELGKRIAIKALRADLANEDRVIWLRREIHATRKLSHPNICRVEELVQTQTTTGRSVVFLTMELLEGETLLELLRREGPLTERRALPLVRQMVAALTAAHQQGIVHRDFKSSNIMIVPRADGPARVVVTDFGLAGEAQEGRRASTLRSRETVFAAGTPAYMAPEQIEGRAAGRPADIYALGVVLYEMTTGDLPYADESPLYMAVRKTRERPRSPVTLAPTLRLNWEAAILQCLDPKPTRRPESPRAVLDMLGTRSRTKRVCRAARRPRYRWIRRGIAAAALAVVAGLAYRALPVSPDAANIAAWEEGVWALHAGEPAVAARRLERAIGEGRLPAEAHGHLAQAWLDLGFPQRAEGELRASILQPLQSESSTFLFDAVREQLGGNPKGARDLLERRPASAESLLRPMALADLAAMEERLSLPTAAARWRDVLNADPDNAAANLRLARLQARAGLSAEAERYFLAAEIYWKARGDVEMLRRVSAERGLTFLSAGQFENAREDLPSLGRLLHLPKDAGYGPCERFVVVMAGVEDQFALPFDRVEHWNETLRSNAAFPSDGRLKQFDEKADDQGLFVSLPLPSYRLCSGSLEAHVRGDPASTGRANDSLSYGIAGERDELLMGVASVWDRAPTASEFHLVLELSGERLRAVQGRSSGNSVSSLDVSVGDDTTVDYIKLTLVY